MPHSLKTFVMVATMACLPLAGRAQLIDLVNILASGDASETEEAAAPPAPQATPQEVEAALAAPVTPLDVGGLTKSTASLKGKRFYIAEYRVLFEVGGNVSANTRAAYFGGVDYGGTHVSVNYALSEPDFALLQAITDKAYADFLRRLQVAGLKAEPADEFVREHGAVYEATVEGSKPGAEVRETAELGYGKRTYLVFAPTGTKMVSRGFAGMGAGNIGTRINFSKANLEGVSVSMVVNLAAQESSGSGSSMFKRGSSANASAAMEVAMPFRETGVLQTHVQGNFIGLRGPLAVPGQFGNLRTVGSYDSQKDVAMVGLQVLGRLTMGVAGNATKRMDMALDVDNAALARQALQGMVSVNQAVIEGIR